MAWSEHQHAQLRAMGLRLWTTPTVDQGLPPVVGPVPARDALAGVTRGLANVPASHTASPPARPAPSTPASVRVAEAAPSRAPLAMPSELASLGWSDLRQAVAQCQACTLCESRTQTVFGVGHEQAQWLVVGEAPGENEDRQGEPFVGAAGQLLDRMLAALKLTRGVAGEEGPEQRVYIANTLKCRPPRNRNPAPEEMAKCEPFLVRQIELLRPRIILAMGRFAVQALLRSDEPIGRLRGRVHHYQGVPLVVTYHPAYLLRSPLDKSKAWEDLCLAADVAEGVRS